MSSSNLSPELQAMTERRYPDDWSELDTRAIDTVRVLAADAVQNCGSGHPGTAMSLAPLAYTLYQHVLDHAPKDVNGQAVTALSCQMVTPPDPVHPAVLGRFRRDERPRSTSHLGFLTQSPRSWLH